MKDVKGYIENEIYYIECYDRENRNDLKDLYSLTEEDINKIQEQVDTDSELSNNIDELVREAIHYWLYHYIEKKKESENNE